jgi:uncharacterized protein (DUF2236 family)
VHEERAVGLMYGQRALMIGALKPLNFVGTMAHTGAGERWFRRLAHTGAAFETVFFEGTEEADRVLANVRRMHERVRGELPEDAGITPAGTSYSAFDPELMLWTVAVTADSALCFYELLVGDLDGDERERLWQDYVRFGELFGMPREVAPSSYGEFREWWAEQLAGSDLHLTPLAARMGVAIAFEIPLPRAYGPMQRLHNLIMLGGLPPRVRELYGLGWNRAQARAYRAAVRGLRGLRPVTPRALRRGGNVDAFRLVARTERRLLARGRAPSQQPA